ncbi:MAG TPA: hypothetical protein VN923_11790, partial [Thermoanaerobaculia bacterium]|nr:hypothetical protein [Thermoanaerobaculia bacterium]
MKRWLQVALLAALALGVGLALRRTFTRLAVYRSTERVCSAVDAGDWNAALAASSNDLPPTVAGLRAADCRCVALMQTGRKAECTALLERELAAPAARDWLPRPLLVAVLVEQRRQKGDVNGALQLAIQGADRAPGFLPLLLLEGQLRLQLQSPAEALRAMDARLPSAGEGATRLRTFLATEAMARDAWEEAAAMLGEQPPPAPDRDAWFTLRMSVLTHLGRPRAALDLVESWQRAGGNPAAARATYAYLLSTTQQTDPLRRTQLELLGKAVEEGDRIGNEDLLQAVYVRYVGTLSLFGKRDEALRRFDEGVKRFGSMAFLDRADVMRGGDVAAGKAEEVGAPVRFVVAGAQPGDRLLLSPDPEQPHDAPFVARPLPAGGGLLLKARFGTWPLRWVLHDASGAVRGSGAVWPAPGADGTTVVRIERRAPIAAAAAAAAPSPRPAAGRRRLFVVILDCGEWRLVRHGLARGELPTFAALTASGAQGVLLSRPAYTAVAVHAIAQPGTRRVDGVIGVLHQLGAEIEGLNFVGTNPLAGLSWVLPSGADLFATLGAGELQTANLLHSYGGLQVGRHGALVGPHGARGTVPLAAKRPLDAGEQALLAPPNDDDRRLLEEMASDFDNAVKLAR